MARKKAARKSTRKKSARKTTRKAAKKTRRKVSKKATAKRKVKTAAKKVKKGASAASSDLKKYQEMAMKELGKAEKSFKANSRKVKNYAKKNPEKALAIAAALGAAVGAILKVRKRRRR